MLSQVAAAYTIAAVLRLRSEEVEGRAEPLLAAPVSRWRWAGSHLLLAAAGSALLLLALGLALGLLYALGVGDLPNQLPRLLARTLWALPAVWVMGALAAALYGWLPRFAGTISWGALGVFLFLELGWELQRVSPAVFDLSPFAHVHWARPFSLTPAVWLVALAVALTAVGLIGLRRRDLG